MTTVGERSARRRFRLTNDFVKFTLGVLEEQVETRLGDSDFDRQAQETLRLIRVGSTRGRTTAELAESSRMFRALKPIEQDAVMDSLKRREAVVLIQYQPSSGRGKPRIAWVATEHVPEVGDKGDEVQV